MDDKLKLDNSAADVLVPLYDKQNYTVFSQLGLRNKDKRNTANIGVGVRTIQGNWMYGINSFYDYDMTGSNRLLGVGAEAWADNLKFSANSYFGLTDWHQSRDFADYNERPANGYDLRAEAFLASHPQLGARLIYEQYRGDEVALFGKDNRQQNPYALTSGLNYTPIPLVTLGAEYRAGKGGQNDSSLNMQVNYQFGQPWSSQLDSSSVARSRSLAGSRYDLVERNNHIVLDYQLQQNVRLTLPEMISGYAGQTAMVTAQVSALHGLKKIEWDTASLTAAGGRSNQTSATGVAITLPPYQTGNNIYMLSAVAYDNKGNVSERASVQLTVKAQEASITQSKVRATPTRLIADGATTSQIVINLRDGENAPIVGRTADLALALAFSLADNALAGQKKGIVPATLGDVMENAPGEYVALLTAGTELGTAVVTPAFGGQTLHKAQVALVMDTQDVSQSMISAERERILADNNDTATVKFTARDANGEVVSGLDVSFDVTGVGGTTLGTVAETEGVYTATLKGKAIGIANVKPLVDKTAVGTLSVDIELTVGTVDGITSAFDAAPLAIEANNNDFSTLTFYAKDANGHAIRGLDVTFDVTGVQGTSVTKTIETDGAYTAQLTGTFTGEASVKPNVNGNSVPGVDGKVIRLTEKPIGLSVGFDRTSAKHDGTIKMTINAKYKDGLAAENVPIEIKPIKARNRQGNAENASVLINGLSEFTGDTGSDGQVTVSITDPNGLGVKTTLSIVQPEGQALSEDVTFTVNTSPDSSFANYYGHMTEMVNGLSRPRLRDEVSGNYRTMQFNNERWVIMNSIESLNACTLATIDELESAFSAMSAGGWPRPNTNADSYMYFSSSKAASSENLYYMFTHSGQRAVNTGGLNTHGYLVCK